MSSKILRLFGIMLLAGASYAQTSSAPQANAPTPPTPPQASSSPSEQQVDREMERARREMQRAQREVERARKESLKARKAAMAAANIAYLGVGGHDVTPERSAELKMKEPHGVEIQAVDQDSPAGKAGLREHDVIVSFNGKPVEDWDSLRGYMRESKPGQSVTLGILRNGSTMKMPVTLGQRSPRAFAWVGENGQTFEIPKIEIPPIPPIDLDIPSFTMLQFSSRNGVMVEDLSPQLGDYFGVKNGQGVLVRSVDRGSPADIAGLKAGDVITKVGSERVTCTSDWRRMIREHRDGTVALGIVRDRREQTVNMKLPQHKRDNSGLLELPGMRIGEIRSEM